MARLSKKTETLMIALYLGAIIAANLSVSTFGQSALILTAFILIPFDLVTRDILHSKWEGKQLRARMSALIIVGSALTALLSIDAKRIAIASATSFGFAGAANTAIYHLLKTKPRFLRMNASNLVAATVDSIIFPVIAFWPEVDPSLCAYQAISKFIGGLFWSWAFLALIQRMEKSQ